MSTAEQLMNFLFPNYEEIKHEFNEEIVDVLDYPYIILNPQLDQILIQNEFNDEDEDKDYVILISKYELKQFFEQESLELNLYTMELILNHEIQSKYRSLTFRKVA